MQERYPEIRQRFASEFGIELHLLSAVTHEGLAEIIRRLWALVQGRSFRDLDVD